MQLRWGRLVLGLIVAELIPILILVALVAAFGPPTQAEAQVYAARLGRWVGPVTGPLTTLLVAWWVARGTGRMMLRHGAVLGCLAAALDVVLLIASGASFEWLFAVSNVGRVLAGTLGGGLAARTTPSP